MTGYLSMNNADLAGRADVSVSLSMQGHVLTGFKAIAAQVKLKAFLELSFKSVSEPSMCKFVTLVLIVLLARFLEFIKCLLGLTQFIKKLHLLHLPLQQLLLKPSKHAIQFEYPLLNHAFITQGDHRLGYSQCGLCALYCASNPIQHLCTPVVRRCGQKASTVVGII